MCVVALCSQEVSLTQPLFAVLCRAIADATTLSLTTVTDSKGFESTTRALDAVGWCVAFVLVSLADALDRSCNTHAAKKTMVGLSLEKSTTKGLTV